jgi:hypothetical protein
MEYVLIIEAILELIKMLQENKDEETLLRRMARPRIHEFRIVMSSLRAKGLRGRELIATTREALEEVQAMDGNEHVALLAVARDFEPGMLASPMEE